MACGGSVPAKCLPVDAQPPSFVESHTGCAEALPMAAGTPHRPQGSLATGAGSCSTIASVLAVQPRRRKSKVMESLSPLPRQLEVLDAIAVHGLPLRVTAVCFDQDGIRSQSDSAPASLATFASVMSTSGSKG